ncbi:MAG: thermitase [Frankiaceae bacterium]|nr:thermitase [Frankiaceae bacterium]
MLMYARPIRSPLLAALASSLLLAPAAHAAGPTLLVKFRTGTTKSQVAQALGGQDARQLRTLPYIGVRVVAVPSGRAAAVRSALARNAAVEFAEPDALATPQEMVPNDPYFPQGTYALQGGAWGWFRTHTTQAWDVTQGSAGVTIAILDTGLRAASLDFGGQVVTGRNVLNGTSDTATNAGNHGTYVAGVAGLAINTRSGNAGYCPGCTIMPVQVGTDSGASYSDMATGIIWAADNGARVENLSWAGTTASSTLASAVSYARSKGVVVMASAGNSNCDCPTYPSATPGVLGVGGVSNAGAKASDSNYGPWVALAAPEGNMTAWPTLNGGPGYAQVGGTSLAAPAAAGIAGLLFSANPTLSGAAVEQALEASARPASFSVSYGEVDAMAALGALGFSDPQAATAPVNDDAPVILTSTNGDYNNTALSAAPQAGQVLVRGQGAWRGAAGLSLSAVKWYRCNADGSGCVAVGSGVKYTVQTADSGYVLRLTISFTNASGTTSASSALSEPVGGTAAAPPAPSNSSPPVISGTAQDGQTLTSSSGVWANSPTSYAYQWRRCDSSGANCADVAGSSATYSVGPADVGATLRVAVTAANSSGVATATSAPTAVVQAAPAPTAAPAQTQTLGFSGSLSAKTPTKTFTFSAGAGAVAARLSFSKCSSLSVTLKASSGSTIGSATGPSVLSLDQTVSAGSYSYVVSGSTRCSFSLTVTSTAS